MMVHDKMQNKVKLHQKCHFSIVLWQFVSCTILMFIFSAAVFAQPIKEPVPVAFYVCQRCHKSPIIDGKLDDLCWQNLPSMNLFYQYWSPTPKPPPLKTSAKVCWDDTGLYIGIMLYDENVDKIKATINDRDNPMTWTDDCVEIMIDPENSATGYYKFTTNFLCARYDEKVTNMIIDSGWNAEGWQVKTLKGENAWFIEFFMPWDDIGVKPKEGEIWSFDLVRYGYSTGNFRGVTWSLGGSYASPENFGYIFFGQFEPTLDNLNRVAKIAGKTKGKYFWIAVDNLIATYCDEVWRKQTIHQWVYEMVDLLQKTLSEIELALKEITDENEKERLAKLAEKIRVQFDELLQKHAAKRELMLPIAFELRRQMFTLYLQSVELKWESLLLVLISNI